MKSCLKTVGLLAVLFAAGSVELRAEPSQSADSPPVHAEPIPVPTLGGKQFWSDELFFHQWRIQRNVVTGHCRLLDEDDRRRAWGTFAQCRAELDEIKRRRELPPMQGKAVIVMHGLARSRSSMKKLCRYLRQQGGYSVFNISYPTTRRPIAEHAGSLARVVEHLCGIEEINFVGHSMGGIVIRHYLADRVADRVADGGCDRRIKRMVMIAPPNHGSLAATALSKNGLFTAINGTAGKELGTGWDKLEKRLATPPFEFGIIAGGRGDGQGYNPLLPGDDDAIVTVKSTRLAGAADFTIVPAVHSFIMDHPKAIQHTLRFLQTGCFISPKQRRPIKEE